jgi:hypothetical protein
VVGAVGGDLGASDGMCGGGHLGANGRCGRGWLGTTVDCSHAAPERVSGILVLISRHTVVHNGGWRSSVYTVGHVVGVPGREDGS